MVCCPDMDVKWEDEVNTDPIGQPYFEGDCRNCGKRIRETWTESMHTVVDGGEE